jgi:hypothetical protein
MVQVDCRAREQAMPFSKFIVAFGAAVTASYIGLAQPAAALCIPANFPGNWLRQQEQAGGHTLRLHVGKSDALLIQRLRNSKKIKAASSYTNRQTAANAITAELSNRAAAINRWAQTARRGAKRADNFAPAGGVIGRVATRPPGPANVHNSTRFLTVIRATGRGNCYLLTSYPT